MQHVTVKLPPAAVVALARIAAREDVSIGQLIRTAVSREIERRTIPTLPPLRSASRDLVDAVGP